MRTINLYVEGKSDLIFLCQLLVHVCKFDLKLDLRTWKASYSIPGKMILSVQTITPKDGEGGIDAKKIQSLVKEIQTVNMPKGLESVLFIDADSDKHVHPKGGFISRDEYLKKLQKEATFEYFIIPTHSEDGNLETILDDIVCDRGKDFYTCLTKYVDGLLALTGVSRPQYIIDNPQLTKEKIAWYVYMMEGKDKKVASGLQNAELWNFQSSKLTALTDFLKKLFQSN